MLLSTVIIINILIFVLVIITAEKPHNVLAMCMYCNAQEKSKKNSEL